MLASIILRTLNEDKHLNDLLNSIKSQKTSGLDVEVILVDSGSTDNTIEIAKAHNCKILHIRREDFSFGRSLNIGCEEAVGDFLVIVSGHCVPTDEMWLQALCDPLLLNKASYTYGRQIGGPNSFYSECRIFAKYYPEESLIPQEGFYCNNANAAIKRSIWEQYRFDEQLTGLEDMALGKRLVEDGEAIAYVANACVYHHHDESWSNIKRRFERESIALQEIMPQIHIHKLDLVRYILSSVWLDCKHAFKRRVLLKEFINIVQYRYFQYLGSYVGNHNHRRLSHAQKEEYFYPNELRTKHGTKNRGVIANEGK